MATFDMTSMLSDAVRRVSSTIGIDTILADPDVVEGEDEEETKRKFRMHRALDTHMDAPFQRFKIKPMGRLITRPIRVEGLGSTIRGVCHVRCLVGEESEGFSPHARVMKRTAEFNPNALVSIVLNKNTISSGKNISLELQVWRGEGDMHDSSIYSQEDDGEEDELDEFGAPVGKGPIGVARLALDQLTLGVPGTVQLHQQGVPAVLRGTLTLVVTYEPPPKKSKGGVANTEQPGHHKHGHTHQTTPAPTRRRGSFRGGQKSNVSDSSTLQVTTSTPTKHKGIKIVEPIQNTTIATTGVTAGLLSPGGYEKAVDPNTGQEYWFNRTTGDRTWTDPNNNFGLMELGLPTPRW